jgi:succinoglycan biosynthesis transport protein ExoP
MSETTGNTHQPASEGSLAPSPWKGDVWKGDAREIIRLLNRRKWQLTGVTAIVVVLAALLLTQLTPQYRATALLMLDTRKAKVTNTADVLSGLTADVAAIQTEIEVLRSASLLGKVVDKLHLESDPEFGAPDPSPISDLVRWLRESIAESLPGTSTEMRATAPSDARERAIRELERSLLIQPRGRSYVIAASVDSIDPKKAKRIVDVITDFYIVDQLNAKFEANKRATEWLQDRLSELRSNVEAADRAASAFRLASGLTLGKDSTVISQSLTELNSQLIQARGQRADRESRLIALQRGQHDSAQLGSVTEVVGNPLIASLRAQEAEVGRRVGDLAQRYGDSHPRLLQARAELGQIQSRIGAEIAKIISSVQSDAEAAKSKEVELQSQVDLMQRQAGGLGQDESKLRQLERDAQSSRVVYEDFLKRFKELREQQDIQQPDSRVLSAAAVPTGPIYPRYTLILAGALAVGLGLGVLIIMLIERLDGGFRSSEQLEAMTGRPTIGMIPSLSRFSLGNLKPARMASEKPESAYAEALRSVHTAIMLGSLDKPPRIIMVTSALPAEGKSTFTASLAALLAQSNRNKKIILVDCDLRRSSVTETLGLKETGGTIDEYLSGAKPLEAVLGRDEASGLYYIPGRSNTPNSAEILSSNTMHHFIDGLAEMYDFVFLDTPPIMAIADARVVAQLAEYIVFIVRWETTPRELALNALKLLRDLKKSVGIVLAQVNIRRHARYGYGDYGYYYSKYRSYYNK